MKTLDEILKAKTGGLYYGNRILLPFSCDILKLVIKNDIITDFNPYRSKGAVYIKHDNYTEVYFMEYDNLLDAVAKFDTIKMVVVESGLDIFDMNTHRKLSVDVLEDHKLTIEEINNGEILFIE